MIEKKEKLKTSKPNFNIDEITLVLIVAVLALIVSIAGYDNKAKRLNAPELTEIILDDHVVSFASNGIIDENKLKEIQSMKYEDIKNSLKIKNDFCIYIEDENGNIILAKGSTKLNEDGLYCKE